MSADGSTSRWSSTFAPAESSTGRWQSTSAASWSFKPWSKLSARAPDTAGRSFAVIVATNTAVAGVGRYSVARACVNPYHNAWTDSFTGTLKAEMLLGGFARAKVRQDRTLRQHRLLLQHAAQTLLSRLQITLPVCGSSPFPKSIASQLNCWSNSLPSNFPFKAKSPQSLLFSNTIFIIQRFPNG